MNSSTADAAAARLRAAYSIGPIAPLREALAPTDGETAYRIQSINTDHWRAAGRRLIGRKIGLTSPAVQKQLGVDQPDFGVLFEDMRIRNAGTLLPAKVLQPKAEAEVALILAKDLLSTTTRQSDVMAATAVALAAIEIVDSRIADWKITFADTVADNASSAYFVIGESRRTLLGLDLAACKMQLKRNGEAASSGQGANCMGHPLEAAAWLANTAAQLGDPLRAGDIILTGALGPMVTLQPGDHIQADIDGLGSVSFTYAEKSE